MDLWKFQLLVLRLLVRILQVVSDDYKFSRGEHYMHETTWKTYEEGVFTCIELDEKISKEEENDG